MPIIILLLLRRHTRRRQEWIFCMREESRCGNEDFFMIGCNIFNDLIFDNEYKEDLYRSGIDMCLIYVKLWLFC